MSINFFKENCKSSANQIKFGIYDAEDNTPARIVFEREEDWNAIVLNDNSVEILFIAIDHCVEIIDDNGNQESSCDAALYYANTLLFIELKNKRASWQIEGLTQIESTIIKMQNTESDFYNSFSKKIAIVANRKHKFPCFHEQAHSLREFFYKKYKARIQLAATIKIE